MTLNAASRIPPQQESSGPTRAGWRGEWLIVLAAVLWSTNGLFMKSPPMLAADHADRGLMLACYRVLISGTALVLLVDWKRVRFRWGLVPLVLCFASMNWSFSHAMVYTSAAVACFLQYTATGWAVLLGILFLREKLSLGNLLALATAMIGIGWILHDQWAGANWYGAILSLAAGISYAGIIIMLRLLRDEEPSWLICLGHLFSGLVMWPAVIQQSVSPTGSQWIVLVMLGLFQMALPYRLFAQGLHTVPAQEAGLLTLLEAVLAPLWVALIWGEHVSLATWIGGGWILSGLVLRYVVFTRMTEPKSLAADQEAISTAAPASDPGSTPLRQNLDAMPGEVP